MGLIEKTIGWFTRAVKSISDQIGFLIDVSGGDMDSLVQKLIVTFVVVVFITCLPVFFKD
jgi:hypothetical protein